MESQDNLGATIMWILNYAKKTNTDVPNLDGLLTCIQYGLQAYGKEALDLNRIARENISPRAISSDDHC